jgi:multicomponent Na+:H+ antiporter subunit B
MLAASFILMRLTAGVTIAQLQFNSALAAPLGALGVLIYFGTGFAAMVFGGNFLDYKFLPLAGLTGAELRAFGILIVEVGVGLAVMAILTFIYDNLLGEPDNA